MDLGFMQVIWDGNFSNYRSNIRDILILIRAGQEGKV